MTYTLLCITQGGNTPFSITVNETQTVHYLKGEIKKKAPEFNNFDDCMLTLYKINVDISDDDKYATIMHNISQPDYVFDPKLELIPIHKISKYFAQDSERNINILAEPPQSESIHPGASGAVAETMLVPT